MAGSQNVFSALNQMFITGTTQAPLFYAGLSQTTMQTLYIGSFFVYVLNNGADWLLTYAVGKHKLVTFAPKDWVVWLMIGSCTVGSVFTFVLLFLCLETAFRTRTNPLEAFKGGCELIFQKLWGWITDVNCFRLSFLIMIFEDGPMTVMNFWLLSACMVPLNTLPKEFWLQVLSTSTTLLALIWRLCLTYYGYKHVWLIMRNSVPRDVLNYDDKRSASSAEDSTRSMFAIPRQYPARVDESFGMKYALWKTFGSDDGDLTDHTMSDPSRYSNDVKALPPATTMPDSDSDSDDSDKTPCPKTFAKGVCCCLICSGLYCFGLTTCFAPCVYHYTCRKNARFHRNRCARSCVKNTSKSFYVVMLLFSATVLVGLIVVNSLWLSSAYVAGDHHMPPGIRYVCAFVDEGRKTALLSYQPALIYRSDFAGPRGYCYEIAHIEELKNLSNGPYPLANGSLFIHIARNPEGNDPLLRYSYSFLVRKVCVYRPPDTRLKAYFPTMRWPYWTACERQDPEHVPDLVPNGCFNATVL